jgi:hypothetical protein
MVEGVHSFNEGKSERGKTEWPAEEFAGETRWSRDSQTGRLRHADQLPCFSFSISDNDVYGMARIYTDVFLSGREYLNPTSCWGGASPGSHCLMRSCAHIAGSVPLVLPKLNPPILCCKYIACCDVVTLVHRQRDRFITCCQHLTLSNRISQS